LGLVYGQILRIYQLCSKTTNINKELLHFYKRLVDRGYSRDKLLPLFEKGVDNATDYILMTLEQREARIKAKVGKSDERIFLYIPFHPQNPSSGNLQHLWNDLIYLPPGEENLNRLKNHLGHRVPVKRLIVAYRCNPNIANLTSYRKLSSRTGLKVSLFI
jgi:hypothetical protein